MADLTFELANKPVSIVDNASGNAASVVGNRLQVDAQVSGSSATLQGKKFRVTSAVRTKVGAPEGPVVLVRNPAGSGKNLIIDEQTLISIDQGVNLIFRTYFEPTVTAVGTALTIRNSFLGDATASIMEMYFEPTISANGTLVEVDQARDNMVLHDIKGNMVIKPGYDMLVTLESSGNNKKWSVDFVWTEETV